MSTFHQFSARSLRGEPIDFSRYAGKTVLVVNTASQCGLTPQYAGLEALYQKHRDEGLGVKGLVQSGLNNYGVSFPMFKKVDVNGAASHPLFTYLRSALPGLLGGKIRWNFTKFLVGRDGKPIKRFAPITKPARLEAQVRQALGLTP